MRLWLGIGVAGVACLVATGAFGGSGSDKVSGARTMQGARGNAEIVATGDPKAGLAAYGTLPLSFVPNAGQLDRRVRYSAQAAGTSFFFTRKEAVSSFAQNKKLSVALRLRFLGANRNVAIRGERPAPGRVNYLLGNDPSKWHTGLRSYERVVYRNLWPGVHMAFAGQGGTLKYEFLVRPGARVRDIRLAYRGAERLSLDRAGNLLLRTPAGALTDTRPTSYQLVAGKRVPVQSSFALGRHGAGYGFALGRGYDRRYPLVIDPGLLYSTFLGGGWDDVGWAIAVDGAGSVYVTGKTSSSDFPTTAGAFDMTLNGPSDAFVTKLDASGATLGYSTYLGGGGEENRNDSTSGIAVDGAGGAYLTGSTYSADFPTTAGAFDTTYNGGSDAFVTKLDASGALGYSTFLGGGDYEFGSGIAVDGAGSAYLTGDTESADFPTTAGAFDRTPDYIDAFVTKLNASGSALSYSTFLDGAAGRGIALDGAGSAYLTGETYSSDFPTTAGAFDTTFNGSAAFVTKLNASGSALGYSTYLGNCTRGSGIAVDGAGSAYVTGYTVAGCPTTAGAFDTTYNGDGSDWDGFVTKLNASGSALSYSTYLGGSELDTGDSIVLDDAGSAYLTGETESQNFPTTAGAFDTTENGGYDAFVTKLNASGAALGYSSFLGGSSYDHGYAIALDGAGSAYLTGQTSSANFPTTAGAFDTSVNPYDAFVTKLDLGAQPPKCKVPRVIGLKLSKAKAKIRKAHCKVGKIRRARSKRPGRVIGQSPRPGAKKPNGFRVKLVVGRR